MSSFEPVGDPAEPNPEGAPARSRLAVARAGDMLARFDELLAIADEARDEGAATPSDDPGDGAGREPDDWSGNGRAPDSRDELVLARAMALLAADAGLLAGISGERLEVLAAVGLRPSVVALVSSGPAGHFLTRSSVPTPGSPAPLPARVTLEASGADEAAARSAAAAGGTVSTAGVTANAGATGTNAAVRALAADGFRVSLAIPVIARGRAERLVLFWSRDPRGLDLAPSEVRTLAQVLRIAVADRILANRLRETEGRYRELFEHALDAILMATPDWRVSSANRSAETIFGRNRAQLNGMAVSALVEGSVTLGAGPQRMAGLRPDGSRFPVEAHAAQIDLDGEPRLMLQVRDLTERERVQDQLLQAQKMETIGALVGGVSHELNNPLTAVRGYAELIESERSYLPATTREDARRIREAGEKAISLVKTFADFARERPSRREAFSLAEIIEGCQALLRFDFMQPLRPRSSAGVRVAVDLPPALPRVLGDPSRIEQILLTLLQNSLDAFRDRAAGRPDPAGVVGSITVSARVVDDRVRITVSDDGPGIPATLRERLFTPFATSKPDGRGLGLWVAAGIAAANGGSLTLEPSDVGATFVVELAVEQPPGMTSLRVAPAPPKAVSGAPQPENPWVLIVDDDDTLLRLAVRFLEGQGWNVALAEDGTDALFQARSHPFDLILMDHRMPGRTGAATYRDLVAGDGSYRYRVILMSGNEYDPDLTTLAGSGVPVIDKTTRLSANMLATTLRHQLEAVGRRP